MDRVIGLDVSKNNVVACVLTSFPLEPRQFYLEGNFERLYANAEGIRRLLELQPTIAVLEPTGVNYSKIWVAKLAQHGVKVFLVGHRQLRIYRSTLDLPDKDDDADALSLGCYYWQYRDNPLRFVRERDDVIALIRDRVLRLHHLNRLQSPAINRIKQDLAWAFPEKAKVDSDCRLFWRWLAGESKSLRYDAELQNSCGLGLTEDIQFAAKLIVEIHRREELIEKEIRALIQDDRFTPYRKVFARYGFGQRTEALILSQLFPLANYLDGGKPKVINSRGRVNGGKNTNKKISERKFSKALGTAPTREWSGDGARSKKAGSSLCRTALWQWIFTRIEVKRGRLKNERFLEIAERFDQLKESGIPIKLVRGKVSAFAVRRLFYDLVDELKNHPNEGDRPPE